MKVKIEQTCGGCPEAYDVFSEEGEHIGYLRLRHGYYRAYAEVSDKVVYEASPKGDGVFESDERDYFLNEGCKAIIKAFEEERNQVLEEACVYTYSNIKTFY